MTHSHLRDNPLSRRAAIASLGAAGLTAAALAKGQPADVTKPATPTAPPAPVTPPVAPPAPAQPQDLNGAGFYRFKLGGGHERGGFTVVLLNDGTMPMGGADGSLFPMIGANGSATREQVAAAAARVMVPPAKPVGHVHALLIDGGKGKRILIDTGCGSGMGPGTGRVPLALQRAGYEPASIDAVLLTHLHPDHIGGVMEGQGLSRYPNARYFMAKAEHDFWSNNPDLSGAPLPPQMAGLIKQGAATLCVQLSAPAMKDRFALIADNDKVADLDTVRAVLAVGHTPGHLGVRISAGPDSLLFITDAAHYAPVQLANPDWQVAYDTDGKQAAQTRRRILTAAAGEKTLLCGSHLPFPALGWVRAEEQGFAWVPRAWEW